MDLLVDNIWCLLCMSAFILVIRNTHLTQQSMDHWFDWFWQSVSKTSLCFNFHIESTKHSKLFKTIQVLNRASFYCFGPKSYSHFVQPELWVESLYINGIVFCYGKTNSHSTRRVQKMSPTLCIVCNNLMMCVFKVLTVFAHEILSSLCRHINLIWSSKFSRD